MNIILIGFMGSGKSTVAKKLSDILKIPLLEMDEIVLKKTNTKTMHEVFALGGEKLLRQTELVIAQEWIFTTPHIVSTGGGVVLNPVILNYLKQNGGRTFFLNASFETIASRLMHDTMRPLFKNLDEAKALYDFRLPLYLKHANEVIEVDQKSIEQIALEIVQKDRLYG